MLIDAEKLMNEVCDGDCYRCDYASCAGCMKMYDAMAIRDLITEIVNGGTHSDERDKETVGVKKMGISKTADMMCSSDYKDRFIAEYLQLRYRYEKLRMFNARIKAAAYAYKDELMPKHDCPDSMLFDQERAMEEYMRILEGRAVIEGIDLEEALEKFYETN